MSGRLCSLLLWDLTSVLSSPVSSPWGRHSAGTGKYGDGHLPRAAPATLCSPGEPGTKSCWEPRGGGSLTEQLAPKRKGPLAVFPSTPTAVGRESQWLGPLPSNQTYFSLPPAGRCPPVPVSPLKTRSSSLRLHLLSFVRTCAHLGCPLAPFGAPVLWAPLGKISKKLECPQAGTTSSLRRKQPRTAIVSDPCNHHNFTEIK